MNLSLSMKSNRANTEESFKDLTFNHTFVRRSVDIYTGGHLVQAVAQFLYGYGYSTPFGFELVSPQVSLFEELSVSLFEV